METPSLRVRLEFGDRSILSKTQRSDGMNKSWLLLKLQQHRTISDVCTHLLHIFKLSRSCPNGILLSMEGFVLPPFESTEILKDKELICVKKKGGTTPDGGNLLDKVEDDDLELENNDYPLLANDKFDNGTGEHQTESDEDDEDYEEESEDEEEEPVSKKRKASMKLQNPKRKKRQCLGDAEETEELENVKNVEQVNQVSAPSKKKMASRSARRKKAKRKWMRELAKISKKKPHAYSKPVINKAENKEANNGRPKGLLHWKQASKKAVHKNRVEQESNENRVGHIRFQNLDEDEAIKQSAVSNEAFRFNSKKKRWGTGKLSSYPRNESKRIDKKSLNLSITDMQVPVIDPNDFSKLPPCCSPKEGDVIAYRLLELSSSWIPEFSSFRVGRISYYDARDIVLIPVPEYPIVTDKTDENRPNDSLYGEDGTLEINYSALLDVSYVKKYEPEAKTAVTNDVVNADKDTSQNLVSSCTNVSNPWDPFCKVNSNTDAANKPESSNPWLNPSKPESLTGWTGGKNDWGEGSSWGRPWSSRGSLVKVQNNNQTDRAKGRPWSRSRPK